MWLFQLSLRRESSRPCLHQHLHCQPFSSGALLLTRSGTLLCVWFVFTSYLTCRSAFHMFIGHLHILFCEEPIWVFPLPPRVSSSWWCCLIPWGRWHLTDFPHIRGSLPTLSQVSDLWRETWRLHECPVQCCRIHWWPLLGWTTGVLVRWVSVWSWQEFAFSPSQ